jgi:hypothetical protein
MAKDFFPYLFGEVAAPIARKPGGGEQNAFVELANIGRHLTGVLLPAGLLTGFKNFFP